MKKSLVLYGYTDDVIVDFLNNPYITKKQNEMEHEDKHDMPIRTRFQESSAASDDSRACNLNDASDG